MSYVKRILDKYISDSLQSAGAVVVRGPKACGKTETALQYAKSSVNLLYDANLKQLAHLSPGTILEGETPRLIDEWQEAPNIWNSVKSTVDDRKQLGQFILTGSSTVDRDINLHSGAGRFVVHDMSTMTWAEIGHSNSSVSLGRLLKTSSIQPTQNNKDLKNILTNIVIGGWPILIGKNERQAREINKSYVDLLLSDDISRVSGKDRDRKRAMKLFMSLARNVATAVDIATLASDSNIETDDDTSLSRNAAYEYLDDLKKLMIVVEQPAWKPHIRSAASLRTTPKRHIIDPSLAVASLGLSSTSLIDDLNFVGFLFESQVFHDISVYARANDAEVSYYRDSYDNEVDIIVESRSGDWAAFEVKLSNDDLDEAARKLIDFSNNINTSKTKKQGSLNIITGVGYAYQREDGVNVLPLSVIGK